MKPLVCLFLAAFDLMLPSAIRANEIWTHCTVLDAQNKYHLCWTPTEDTITFKVEVMTRGYVGLGFSPHGGMTGSDIVIGWVSGGKVFLQDRHGVGNTLPPMDDSQDWEPISGSENDTHTSLTFKRKLQTCDTQDMEIDGSTMHLIYAYHTDDPKTPDSPRYHGRNRGARSIMLLQPKPNKDENLEGMAYWDVKSPNYTITSHYSSMYWCKIHRAPELDQKHHIIRIEPAIQPNNERYVHHMVLYECVGGVPEDLEAYVEHDGHECYAENMPPSMKKCEGVFAAWGVGGEPMVFPDHVGLPLEAEPRKYYMLEIHYDNPAYDNNVMDESGFRIYYTPELREYDAGTFMIGSAVSPRVFIPPLQKEFTVVGHTSYECINSELPDDGVKMLGVLLHAHLLGRHVKARHFRKNEELPPLSDDRYYDFNYQEYHYFKEEVPYLQDDQITVECTYDSSERDRVTYGGLSTKDEMCLAFIMYYPRIERFGCLTAPTLPLVVGAIGAVTPTYQDENVPSALPTLLDLIKYMHRNLDWDSVNISVMENAFRYSPHQVYCYIGTGSKGEMQQLVSYPKNLVPYEKPSKCPRKPEKRIGEVEGPKESSGLRSECGIFTLVFSLVFTAGFVPSIN